MRGEDAVAPLARALGRSAGRREVALAVGLHRGRPVMTREQFETWSRMFAGTTVQELRHFRDVPRAAIQLPIVQPIARGRTRALRRAG